MGYVQGLQKTNSSAQLAEDTVKHPIAVKQEVNTEIMSTHFAPVVTRNEMQNVTGSAPVYNANGISNTSCSLPPLLGGGFTNGVIGGLNNSGRATDSLLTNFNESQNLADCQDFLQFQEETLVTEQDCLLMNLTEDDILSQIDDLFFDISPPQSNQTLETNLPDVEPTLTTGHNLFNNIGGVHDPFASNGNFNCVQTQHQQIIQQNTQNSSTLQSNMGYEQLQNGQQFVAQQQNNMSESYRTLAVCGSKIEPPLNWSPSPRNLLLHDSFTQPKVIKTEQKEADLTASNSSWLQCSQTSLSLSNNSDWLRDSHERIMKGGQLSEEELELSGHGLATRAFLNSATRGFEHSQNGVRFISHLEPENCLSNTNANLQNEKLSNVELTLNESILSQDSFPQHLMNSSNEFNSPKMLDLSCLPEPLA